VRLARLVRALDRALAAFLAVLLAAIVLAVTWQVVSRYLLGDASGWTEELARFLLIWIGLFGGALAYQRRLHLGIDLLALHLQSRNTVKAQQRNDRHPQDPRSEKPRKSNDRHRQFGHPQFIDGCVLVFAAAALVAGGSALVALTVELEQYSPALGLPMAIVYLALPLSGILICLSALAAIVDPGGGHGTAGDGA